MLKRYIEKGSIKQDCDIKALILHVPVYTIHYFKNIKSLSVKLHVCGNTFKTIFQICSFTHRLKSLREVDFINIFWQNIP